MDSGGGKPLAPKPPGRILGRDSKVRYVPAHPLALERIHDYLQPAGHGGDDEGPLFEARQEPGGAGDTERPLTHGAIYHRVLRKHAKAAGIDEKRVLGIS
jgi:integrase